MEQIVKALDSLLASARYADLEAASRDLLARHRFYLWHLYLIVALLRTGQRDAAARELDDLFSYKFNIHDRAWPEIKEAFPEKFGEHYILSTMKPEIGLETAARVRKRWTVPYPISDEAAFGKVVDELVADCMPAMAPLDAAATRITTFGSCFAANLARSLKDAGLDATTLLIEESINSPLTNRAFLATLAGDPSAAYEERIEGAFGAQFVEKARGLLSTANVIVMTLGVAPAFFHRESDALVFLEDYRPLIASGRVYMRTPGVEETKGIVADVLGFLRAMNAGARLYVTISPVPLMGTAELSSALIADCVSKTTLRAALHELLQERAPENVHYWPSFEIVRWLGAHTSLPMFGADDRASRHVSNWAVDLIVQRFRRHLFGRERAQAADVAI